MAQSQSIFSKLKDLGKELDRRVPELEGGYKNRCQSDEKEALRGLLLRQLQEDVNSKKKECEKLASDINSRGTEFFQFLALANVVAQQQSERVRELQEHLQKYGYEPRKNTQEMNDQPETENMAEEPPSSPMDSEEGQAVKSPPKEVHHGPWTLDRTPTLEDFGLHPNFMERVNLMVEQSNQAMQDYCQKYGEDGKAKQLIPPKSEQKKTDSKTPANFSDRMVFVTPGIFDGRIVPDTGDPKAKYFESPPAGSEDAKDVEIQATPRWVGFQKTMMEETPEPLCVQAKRVAKASGLASLKSAGAKGSGNHVKGTPENQGQSSSINNKTTTFQVGRGLGDTPPTPEMVSDVGKRWVADLQASVRKVLENKDKGKKNSGSIGTPQSPVFMTPGLKLKKGPVSVFSENVPSPRTPVFMTPGLNKTKSLPSLAKHLDENACATPKTPECMKRFYHNTTILSAVKTGTSVAISYTTDDIPTKKENSISPEMTYNKRPSAVTATPKTPELLTSTAEVQRMLKSFDLNKHGNAVPALKKMAPFGGSVKVRTGVTPLVPKASHLPYITPGKENRTLNFTGVQPEFNLIVEPVTEEEYYELPNYQRRQFTFNTLNKVVEKINALLEIKLANDEPLQLAEEEVVKELGPSAFTLLMIMSCLGRINKCSVQGKFMYTVL